MNLGSVLVVGAGLAGTLLASSLMRRGISVDLIEKVGRWNIDDGAGLLLTANGTRMLRGLGRQDIEVSGHVVEHVSLCNQTGAHLARIDCQQHGDIPFLSYRYATLREQLGEDVPVKFATTLKDLAFAPNPVAKLSDGSQRSYDLVVGADGVHSNLRSLLFSPQPPMEMRQYFGYRFIAPTPAGLVQPATFLGNGLTFLLVPLSGNQTYCAAGPISTLQLEESETAHASVQRIYAEFGGFVAEVVCSLSLDTRFIPSRFWTVEQPSWSQKSCVLIGDAAHAMPPTLSQGAALAFEDVFVLLSCLERHRDMPQALLEFERRRRGRVDHVQRQSIARMHANIPITSHAAEMRQKMAGLLGARATQELWTQLVEQQP